MILKNLKTRKNINESLFNKLTNNFFSYNKELIIKKESLYKNYGITHRFETNNVNKKK